jgi:hypothetical protein
MNEDPRNTERDPLGDLITAVLLGLVMFVSCLVWNAVIFGFIAGNALDALFQTDAVFLRIGLVYATWLSIKAVFIVFGDGYIFDKNKKR